MSLLEFSAADCTSFRDMRWRRPNSLLCKEAITMLLLASDYSYFTSIYLV